MGGDGEGWGETGGDGERRGETGGRGETDRGDGPYGAAMTGDPSAPLPGLAPDQVLAVRIRAGDEPALDEALGRHWAPLFRYACRMVEDTDLAEDLVQEGFLRLWERRRRLDPSALRAYLYRIVHNLALDELRRRRRHRAWELVAPRETVPAPRTPVTGGAVPSADEAMAYAIDALPPRRRQAFVLAYLHRMSYREAAEVMGVSPATVKNQIAAALAALRATLEPLRPDPTEHR
jgi:RNA polymerase sigma-19 factor, ECF subfamily